MEHTIKRGPGSTSCDVSLDTDSRLPGIEFIGLEGEGPEHFLGLIASGYVADHAAAAGYEAGKLRHAPDVRVQLIA